MNPPAPNSYPSLEQLVGRTPLVALQRIGAGNAAPRNNVVLGKLEGNNPAGSVKDRPALAMIARAQERGDIAPGDTLIEATSGNTGIALAMAAAIKGYRMVLVMPEDLSIERAQTMRAFGAELILTPKAGGMESARDLALQMQAEGKGRVLDQFGNADNPRAHFEAAARRALGRSRSRPAAWPRPRPPALLLSHVPRLAHTLCAVRLHLRLPPRIRFQRTLGLHRRSAAEHARAGAGCGLCGGLLGRSGRH